MDKRAELKHLIENVLEIKIHSCNENFLKEYEIDSFDFIKMIVAIEDMYQIEIPVDLLIQDKMCTLEMIEKSISIAEKG